MFIVEVSEVLGLRIDGKVFFINIINKVILGISFVGGYILVFDGIYIVWYIFFIVIFGGFLYGKVYLEIYGFIIGMRMVRVNVVSNWN